MKYNINGIQLNVLEQGSGPLTLIFLHYFGGSALEWQSVMNLLSDRYRCVAVDLRGFGDSEAPDTGYSVGDMAEDITCLVQKLGIQNFALVGHSMSGKVALLVAARQATRAELAGLQALVLLSPSPPVPEPIPDDERQKLLRGHGQRTSAEQTLKNITAKPISDAAREQIIADDLRSARPAWEAWLQAGSLETISDRMSSIEVPVSILVGSDDQALPPEVQTRMVLPYVPRATIDIVPGAGHLLPWEVPDVVAAFISKKIAD